MPQYLFLLYDDEATWQDATDADWQAAMEQHNAFSAAAGGAGVLRGGEALQDTSTATTVQATAGEVLTTDGPFAETKEQLGGFYIVECDDLDAAIHWASKIPHPQGRIEVRPLMEFD